MAIFPSIWRRNWRSVMHIGAGLAAVLALPIVSDVGVREHARSQLQGVAERAALAGVQALRDSAGASEMQRREAAVAASRAVAGRIGSARVSVAASVTPIRVSVEISDAPGWLGRLVNGSIDVVGQAGYLPPLQSAGTQKVQLYNRLNWKILTARSK